MSLHCSRFMRPISQQLTRSGKMLSHALAKRRVYRTNAKLLSRRGKKQTNTDITHSAFTEKGFDKRQEREEGIVREKERAERKIVEEHMTWRRPWRQFKSDRRKKTFCSISYFVLYSSVCVCFRRATPGPGLDSFATRVATISKSLIALSMSKWMNDVKYV